MEKTRFEIIEDGTTYHLPVYTVNNNGLEVTEDVQELTIVRGISSDGLVARENGILQEALVALLIHDLTLKNELVPSKQNDYTLSCLDEALESMKARSNDRDSRGVTGTHSE